MEKIKRLFKMIGLTFGFLCMGLGLYVVLTEKKTAVAVGTEKTDSNTCQDKNQAILAFREGCNPATSLGFGSGSWDLKEKWCHCIETNYDIGSHLDVKCSTPNVNLYMAYWNNNEAKVKCGTPNNPL